MSKLFELYIGDLSLWRGDDKAARVAYQSDCPIIITHSQSTYSAAANLLEAIGLQLWSNHAVGEAVFTLYEARPSPLFAHIKRVLAKTQRASGTQLLGTREFGDHLSGLLTLAHQRFGLLANSGVSSLAEYNALPDTHLLEDVQYLMVSELLSGSVRESELQALENLCHQGAKVGIIPLLLRDTNSEKHDGSVLSRNSLREFWKSVTPVGFGFDWSQHPPKPVNQYAEYWRLFPRYGFEIGVPDAACNDWANHLIESVAGRNKIEVEADFLDVPIGYTGNVEVRFRMGAGSRNYHAQIIGATDSGKTTLLHNILVSACESFTPDQLRLWIIDPKGTEFKDYGNLAHVDFLHLGSLSAERTEVMLDLHSALSQFESLIQQRTEKFQAAGTKDITEYNQVQGKSMPYCIFVIDEAPELLNLRQWLELPNGRNFLDRITLKGRSFGLHLILISQSFMDVRYFPDTTKDSFTLRIACKVNSESISRNFFGFGNEAAAHLKNLRNARMAIVNRNSGQPEANQVVHLNNLPSRELNARMTKLREKYPNPLKTNYIKPSHETPQSKVNDHEITGISPYNKELPDWLK